VWENGWLEHIRKIYFPPVPSRCLTIGRKSGEPTPLKLDDFAGAFLLLFIGYGFAMIIFIAERLLAIGLNRIS